MLSPNPSARASNASSSAPGTARDPMSIARTSNPGSRAGSREAVTSSVDPVLSRYLSIKRELDRVAATAAAGTGGGGGGTKSGYQADAATPQTRREVHGAGAGGGLSHQSHTTTASSHLDDVRALLSSPTVNASSSALVAAASSSIRTGATGTSPTVGWSDRLSARLEARQQRQSTALHHQRDTTGTSTGGGGFTPNMFEASSVKSSANSSTLSSSAAAPPTGTGFGHPHQHQQQQQQQHRQQPYHQQVDAPAAAATSDANHHRREIEMLANAVADSEVQKAHMEQLLVSRDEELAALRRQVSAGGAANNGSTMTSMSEQSGAVTFHHHPHPESGGVVGSSTSRHMQGRLETLERLIVEKDERLDREMQRSLQLERRTHELTRQVESLQLTVYSRDQVSAEYSTYAEQEKKEIERLRAAVDEAQRELREERRKNLTFEAEREDHHVVSERHQLTLKEQAREANRHAQELESRTKAAESEVDRMLEMQRESDALLATKEAAIQDLRSELKSAEARAENLKVLSAQDAIVNDELKYEIDRYKKVAMDLREELVAEEKNRKQMENLVEQLRHDVDHKGQVEARLRQMQQTVDSATLESESLRNTVEDLKRRLAEARSDVDRCGELEDQLSDLRAQAQAKQLSLEAMTVAERDTHREVERLKGVVRETEQREELLITELGALQDRLADEERKVQQRDDALRQLGDVMTTFDKLRAAVDEKTRYIVQQQDAYDDLRRQNADLDADVETLLGVKRQVDELAVERQHLLDRLAQYEAEIVELHREAAALQSKAVDKDRTIRDLQELISSMESQLHLANQQAGERANLDTKARSLAQELASRNEDFLRERQQKDEALLRLNNKEERLAEHMHRMQSVEAQVTQLHRELAQSQVEQGRMSVLLETHTKERERLQKEIETKNQMIDQVSEELSTARRELNNAKLELQSLVARERIEQERSVNVVQQQQARQEEIERCKSTIRKLEQELGKKEEAIQVLKTTADRESAASARVDDLQATLKRREDEVRQLQTQLAGLREELADARSNGATVSKLETRVNECKSTIDKQTAALEQIERDDAAKQRLLLERDREMARLRDRCTSLQADLDAERNRKRLMEDRVKELEAECQRASVLDGQVAGLNLVMAQRSKDLEEERANNADLRARLRQTASERSASVRGSQQQQQQHQPLTAELEAKLLVKEQQLRQAQDDLHRAQARIDQLQEELRVSESRRDEMRNETRRITEERDAREAHWAHTLERQERALEQARREFSASADMRDDASRLKLDLQAALRRNEVLQESYDNKAREVATLLTKLSAASHQDAMVTSSDRSASQRSVELAHVKDALRRAEDERISMQSVLQERSMELEIATENLTTLQGRLRQQQHPHSEVEQVPSSSGAAARFASSSLRRSPNPATDTSTASSVATHNATASSSGLRWDVATAEETIQQWREKRRQQMDSERIAQAEYESQVRSKLSSLSSSSSAVPGATIGGGPHKDDADGGVTPL